MARDRLMAPAPMPTGGYSADVSDRLESMVGVDPRDTLAKLREAQQVTAGLRKRIAEKKAELASYKARYGYPSHWEHERKALLSRLMNNERIKHQIRSEKFTESALESQAHAHEEYRSFLSDGLRDRQVMERLDAEVARLHGEIETAEAVEVYYERHCRLNDSLIYHSGREASLS